MRIDYGKYIGECIRTVRKESKLSKTKFANRLGIDTRKLARTERGCIDIPPQRLVHIIFNGIMAD
ncbi:MAG: helix-turn-helix domain-containing protein [Rickettsiales bacterium]|jgi:DNA-binding transcriptional regulator YiaG|nr:helix-turn-helix domain-containing protein [Rickettsiales bacterium]